MDYLEANDLVQRAATVGAQLGQTLRQALADLEAVGDVRGMGMLWGIEFVADRANKAPFPAAVHLSERVCQRCRELGVLFYPGHGSVDGVRGDHLMVAPPFVVTEAEIEHIVTALRQGILDSLSAAGN
jgi:adenosylmethionine-8-amino-7-oxononanoate aminotransferase